MIKKTLKLTLQDFEMFGEKSRFNPALILSDVLLFVLKRREGFNLVATCSASVTRESSGRSFSDISASAGYSSVQYIMTWEEKTTFLWLNLLPGTF